MTSAVAREANSKDQTIISVPIEELEVGNQNEMPELRADRFVINCFGQTALCRTG